MSIHPTAIISDKAKLGSNVKVGPFAIIDADVEIGDNCEIAAKAHIKDGARIGSGNYIGEGTIISDNPQDLKYKGEVSYVKIGNNNTIREYVTIHKSTTAGNSTVIGDSNFLMAMTHVAHDCRLGNNIIIVNYTGVPGHIQIDDYAFISGYVGLHQGIRVGAHSMTGGMTRVNKDIAPYVMVAEVPLAVYGLNKVGLKRRGFSMEKIKQLENVYEIFFNSKLTVKEAVDKIRSEVEQSEEVKYFLDFVTNSKKGISR